MQSRQQHVKLNIQIYSVLQGCAKIYYNILCNVFRIVIIEYHELARIIVNRYTVIYS